MRNRNFAGKAYFIVISKILKALLFIIIIVLFVVGSFFVLLYTGAFGNIPSKAELLDIKNETASVVFSSDGELLGKFFAENRTNIQFPEIPQNLVTALIATEDARFFEHEGVDKRSMFRVVVKTIIMGDRSSGGGSTITQQLAKNLFGRKDYGEFSIFVNKFKEIILARRLEDIYSKEEILTLYLNTVPFGEDVYGIEVASRRFFNKKTNQLKTEEAAVLVGILKANTYYNPRLHPENALRRRNVVLGQMAKYGYLNSSVSDSLQKLPLKLDYSNLNEESSAPYFLVHVRNSAQAIVNEYNSKNNSDWDIEKDGLIINTTLNNEVQETIKQSIKKHLSSIQDRLRRLYDSGENEKVLEAIIVKLAKQQNLTITSEKVKKREFFGWDSLYVKESSILDSLKYSLTQLHAGAIGLNASSGAVLAWVGGIDFQKYPYDQVLAKRQLASTFKPILYAAAIENGAEVCDYLENDPLILKDYDNWQPENYDGKTGGKYSLAAALAFSKNIPTVNLFFRVGFEKLQELWQTMGFSSELENKPSVALGTVSANLQELAEAYGSFPGLGKKAEAYLIESIKTSNGKLIFQQEKQQKQEIISEETALQMNEILLKATNEGTGIAMRGTYGVQYPLAGKTGTSQNFSDAWYVCYNNNFVFATRVGAALPSIHFHSGAYGSGSRLALPILGYALKELEGSPIGKQIKTSGLQVSNEINCPDFKEDSAIESLLDIFSDPATTREEQQKKQERKKKRKGFFDRLFGN